MITIYVLIIVGIGLGGWYGGSAIWRRWKKKKNLPSTETPTPVNPPFIGQ